MSIESGLIRAFQDAQLAREMAEGQLEEIELLCAQWFVDHDTAAGYALAEIGLHQHNRNRAAMRQVLKAAQEKRAAGAVPAWDVTQR